jgi:hypothetical protein
MNYADIINKSVSLFSDRGAQYGEVNYNMERACLIYNTITGERMTPYQANMFLHSLKLARIRSDWKKGDNYFDGINYLAFAGEAAQVKDDVPVPVTMPKASGITVPGTANTVAELTEEMEQEIKDLAAKFAPVQNNGESQ